MTPRISLVALASALSCCMTWSCATFSDLPARPTYTPRTSDAALGVHLTTREKWFLEAGRGWIDLPVSGGLSGSAGDAIRRSGWVRIARDAEAGPTLELEMTQYQSAGPGLLVVLTGFVIPGAVEHHLELKLSLVDAPGARSTCSRTADTRTWYQTLLIFAYPFRSPAYSRMKASEALALQCLAELLERRHESPAALSDSGSAGRIE